MNKKPHLMWVYPVPIASALDSATWLQTTHILRTLGWRVTLIGMGPTGPHSINGVEVFCVSTIQKYFLGQAIFHLRVLLFLVQNWAKIDVVLFHQISVPWLLPIKSLRLLRWNRRPQFVMDTRDLNVVEDNFKNRLRTYYFNLTHLLANWWTDGQTAITPRMADLVKIPPNKRFGFWPSGVSIDRFAQISNERNWPGAHEAIHLMYVGKLHQERNLLPLCHAVEQANQHQITFHLTFIGSGPEHDRLQAFAERTDGRVKVQPPVSHEKIPELLSQAHIGVASLPDPGNRKFEASSPIKLFEYMAAGLPTLSTYNACYTDVVGAGEYVFWAEDSSVTSLCATLTQIRMMQAELDRLGKTAQTAVNQWSWQAAGQKLDQALRSNLPT